jgi:hypothetical protein
MRAADKQGLPTYESLPQVSGKLPDRQPTTQHAEVHVNQTDSSR